MLRRTPCIGICSTTYGDLVCRGCKRFAHEVVGWNGYDDDQRGAVWTRLHELRAGAVRHLLELVDPSPGEGSDAALRGSDPALRAYDPALRAYEALSRQAGEQRPAAPALAHLGLRLLDPAFGGTIEDLLLAIDQEFYRRSVAQYERNYRTPAG
jgi:predicted Fe-S protein YdhL (DUF1289 family)